MPTDPAKALKSWSFSSPASTAPLRPTRLVGSSPLTPAPGAAYTAVGAVEAMAAISTNGNPSLMVRITAPTPANPKSPSPSPMRAEVSPDP